MITPRVPRWAFVIFRPLGLTALHPLPSYMLQPHLRSPNRKTLDIFD